MSDFCRQCSLHLFREDFRDLAGLVTREEVAKGIYANVLCEQCGSIQVDHEGRCVSPQCPEHGKVTT